MRGDSGLLIGVRRKGDRLLRLGDRGLRSLGDLARIGESDLSRGLRGDLGPLGDLILDAFGDLTLGDLGLGDLGLGDRDLIRGDRDLVLPLDLDLTLGDLERE